MRKLFFTIVLRLIPSGRIKYNLFHMILQAKTRQDIAAIVALGEIIWNQHYVPIIGQAQVDYMLEKFQSVSALTDQIEHQQYHYFMITTDQQLVGYIGLQHRESTLFLSKLYVHDSARGQGLGREGVAFCQRYARDNRFEKIQLTVNKNNALAISAYENIGFSRTKAVVMDIGGGYVMDDYVFEMQM